MKNPIEFITPGKICIFDEQFEAESIRNEEDANQFGKIFIVCIEYFIITGKLTFTITIKEEDDYRVVYFDETRVMRSKPATPDPNPQNVIAGITIAQSKFILKCNTPAFTEYLLTSGINIIHLTKPLMILSAPNFSDQHREAVIFWTKFARTLL